MSNPSVENVYTRQTAKELTKKYFWKLLGMVAIAFAIPYALLMAGSAATSLLGADHPFYAVLPLVLMIFVMLLMCGLMLGLMSAVIDLCKGNENVTVGRVFSRMGQCLKAFGLGMWVGLKTMLWMLPGYALVIVGAIMSFGSVDSTTGTISESSAMMMGLATIAGVILLFALAFPAAFRYMLSTYVLADKPETGVFECVRQSKAMMKGHKWQAFKLVLPIILIMYVIVLVLSVAMGAVMALLANTPAAMTILSIVLMVVIIAAMLYYMIRMYLCYTLFYLKRVEDQNPAADAAEAPYAE